MKDGLRHLPAPFRVLLGSQFGWFFLGNGLSMIGTWMQRIACSWLVWDWTHSAFWVGVVAASDLLPVLAVFPFAGVAADRWNRLRMLQVSQALTALNTVVMAVLLANDRLGVLALVLLIGVQGTLTAAVQPARFSMVQQLVPRADLGTAVGLNSVNANLARLIGPALAGAIILHWQIIWVFVLNAAVTILFVLVLLRLRVAPQPAPAARRAFHTEVLEGIAHVWRTPAMRLILLAMFFGGTLVRAVVELIPAIAARSFGEDVTGLAVLTGSAAVGAIVSGLTVGRNGAARLLYGVLFWWGLGGLAAVVLTQAQGGLLAMISAAVLGGSITRGMVSTQTFIQLTAPDALKGRSLSVHGLVARGSPALGALAIGYAADRFGLDHTVLISSTLLLLALLGLAVPLRRAARDVSDTD